VTATPEDSARTPISEKDRSFSRTEISLNGYSGAKVLLIRDGASVPYVRKTSHAVEGNARLEFQARKQRQLGDALYGVIRAPKIIREGVDNGLYYFDMEYVFGVDAATFLRSASLPDVKRFSSVLEQFLTLLATCKVGGSRSFSPRASALQKCLEVHANVAHLDGRLGHSLDTLIKAVECWEMPVELDATLNHGDMTLENILVSKNGQLYLIDMLDSYVDHWVTDLSKIDQDLRAGWYMRKMPPISLSVVQFLRQRLCETADLLDGGQASHMAPLFLCINLARILPYSKTGVAPKRPDMLRFEIAS
jgi:hypothetical protein